MRLVATVLLLGVAWAHVPTRAQLAEFHAQRDARIAELVARRAAIAAQPKVIAMIADALPLTAGGRAEIDDKLHVLQVRLDETANLIEALRHTEPDLWKQREARVEAAMKHLEEARAAAWQAVARARRADTSS